MRVMGLAALLALAAAMPAVRGDVIDTQDGRHIEGIARFAGGFVLVRNESAPAKLKLDQIISFRRDAPAAKDDRSPLHGLMGEFMSQRTPSEPAAIELVPPAGINWGFEIPAPYADWVYNFRLTGFIIPPVTGNYHFRGERFTRVEIDGQPLSDHGFDLSAGKPVKVLIEGHRDDGNHYSGGLFWAIDQGPEEPVPTADCKPPDDFSARLIDYYKQMLPVAYGGLKGEYFADDAMKDRKLARLDSAAALMWGDATQIDPQLKKGVAIRWIGRLKSPKTGTLKFGLSNAGTLWINNQKVIDAPAEQSHGNSAHVGQFNLEQGKYYDLKVESHSGGGFGHQTLTCSLDFDFMPPLNGRYLYPTDDVPRTQILSPPENSAVDATHGLTMQLAIFAGKGAIAKKVEIVTADDRHDVLGEANKPPFEITIHPPEAGEVALQARITNSLGVMSLSPPCKFSIVSAPNKSLGDGWSRGHVGTAHAPDATIDHRHIEMTGKGGGFNDQNQLSLPLVSRLLHGDGEVTAHLVEIKTSKAAVAGYGGLTARHELRADAPHVTLLASAKSNWYIDHPVGSSAAASLEKASTLPIWLRLVRVGPTVSASTSPDGKDWTPAGAADLGPGDDVVIGLTTMALTADEPVTAVFDEVAVRSAEVGQSIDGPAIQLVNGSVLYGPATVGAAAVRIVGADGQTRSFPRDQVGRIIYSALPAGTITQIASGWRGAIIGTDMLDGDLSDFSPDGVTVVSTLFGVRQVTKNDGLRAAVLNDVTPKPQAISIRYSGGQSAASSIRLDGDALLADDSMLGELRLHIADLQSIDVPRKQ